MSRPCVQTQHWHSFHTFNMQNRSNRSLLFGTRADAVAPGGTTGAPATSSAELDAMEADNQSGVDALRGSAGLMKDVRL